ILIVVVVVVRLGLGCLLSRGLLLRRFRDLARWQAVGLGAIAPGPLLLALFPRGFLRRHGLVRSAADQPLSASAPPMISISSGVIAAWRGRLYCSVSEPIMSPAFYVAESMAVMRAPSSEAIDS